MRGDFPIVEKPGPKVESHTLITQIHGRKRTTKEKRRIKSPILQYNKWEPPPASMLGRESPLAQRAIHSHQTPDTSPLHTLAIENEVREIKRALKAFMLKAQSKDAMNKMMREWRIVALVVDRLFFYIYLVTVFVSLVMLFPKS